MGGQDRGTGFAPDDPVDGREPYDWRPRYPPEAQRWIWAETAYVGLLLVACLVMLVGSWLEWPKGWLGLDADRYATLRRFAYGWWGGVFGGALLDLKWLYHSVAKGLWHLDRRLWRFCVPWIGGCLAFTFMVLLHAGGYWLVQPGVFRRGCACVALGILVGFFSDNALAKLSEVAEALFGATRRHPRPKPDDGDA